MKEPRTIKSNRLLLWMAAGLAVLLVVSAVIVIVAEPARFEPGTPEAVVQDYVQAILDDDPDAAWALLAPDLQRRCGVDELEPRYGRGETGRIILVDSRVREQTATVELEFAATYSDGAFDLYESTYEERFSLEKVNDGWRISDVPWPFYWCSGV